MCTLTYIPTKEGAYITSNRDELNTRPTSPPEKRNYHQMDLFFPKDEVAGGSWIASDKKAHIRCLLNGAFESHQREESYRKSRGIILLDSFQYDSFLSFVEQYDFSNIEPFTLVSFDLENTHQIEEVRWDGEKTHYQQFENNQPLMWSARAMYNPEHRKKRRQWFDGWLTQYAQENDRNILKFHTSRHSEDPHYDILMKRENGVATTSVTQVRKKGSELTMQYKDLKRGKDFELEIR